MSTAQPYDYGTQYNAGEGAQSGVSGFSGCAFISSERYRRLDRAQSYYDATQHDWKQWDFEGRIRKSGPQIMQPLLTSEAAPQFVPLQARRPSSPYRLARVIVNAFTSLLFGERRWPSVRAAGDMDTQEFAEALVKASGLASKMIRARNLGGSMGSVALSWRFSNGQPRVSVHNAKHVHVSEWADREELVPLEATEAYIYPQDEWDPQKRQSVRKYYWHRRDWTADADVSYKPAPFERGKEPAWEVEESYEHGDGYPHLVWVQNTPSDEVDGQPDYEGLYENFDVLDILNSVLARGGVLNLDPTLVLKLDPLVVSRGAVKKGSDNALVVGQEGDAEYLELSGTSIEAGIKLFETKRRSALEVAQCIVPDPSEVAATGTSSVAQKMIFAPMLSQGDVLRAQYGPPIKRLLEQMIAAARKLAGQPAPDTDDGDEAVYTLSLPQKSRVEPVTDELGRPTGEETTVMEDHEPGEANDLELAWGPWFAATPSDQLATGQMLTAATGQAAYMSAQTASEVMAESLGRVPGEEWKRITQDKQQKQDELASAFGGDPGGAVDGQDDLPEGAQPRQPATPVIGPDGKVIAPPAPDAAKKPGEGIKINASDLALVITVNEARGSAGLPPLTKPGGGEDPDGLLTMAEFKAKRADVVAQAANADLGKVGDPPDADAPKAPPPGAAAGGFGQPGKPPMPGPKPPPGAPVAKPKGIPKPPDSGEA